MLDAPQVEIAPGLFTPYPRWGRQHRVAGGAERMNRRQRFLVVDLQRRVDPTGPDCGRERPRRSEGHGTY